MSIGVVRLSALGQAAESRARALRPSRLAATVAGSRVLVLGAACAGALLARRQLLWQAFDPLRLSSGLGSLGNVLAAGAVRWDAIHYLSIAAYGYIGSPSTVFYPLYPFLMHVVGLLTGSLALAGVAISLGAFVVALALLARLTELELGIGAAQATVMALALAPLSFYFSAVYTESLFLALSVGAVYGARTGRWRLAIGLAVLASLTRVNGVVLVAPLAMLRWQQRAGSRGSWRSAQLWRSPTFWRAQLPLLAVPGALVAYLGSLALHGFSPLAPFAQEVAYQRGSGGPLFTLVRAVQAAGGGVRLLTSGIEPIYWPSIRGPLSLGAESLWLLAVLGASLAALRLTWRRLPRHYGIYAALGLAVCLSSPEIGQPLMSFDRYVLTIFPLWMAAGAWLAERRRARWAVLGAGTVLLGFFTFQFATWAFIA